MGGMAEIRYEHETGRVALRSGYPEDAWNAYLVGDPTNGAHWAAADQVATFVTVPIPEPPTEPEP